MDEEVSYAIRFRERARRDMDIEMTRLAKISGDAIAIDWLEAILEKIATLAQMPQRCPLAPESLAFDQEIRQLLFRRKAGGPAWRVMFTVEQGGDDAPSVTIRHIRHAASEPISIEDVQGE